MAQLRARLQLRPKQSADASAPAAPALARAGGSKQPAPQAPPRAPLGTATGGGAPSRVTFFSGGGVAPVPTAKPAHPMSRGVTSATAFAAGAAGSRKRPAEAVQVELGSATALPSTQPKRQQVCDKRSIADEEAVPPLHQPVASRPLSSSAPPSGGAAAFCDDCDTPSAPSAPAPPPPVSTASDQTPSQYQLPARTQSAGGTVTRCIPPNDPALAYGGMPHPPMRQPPAPAAVGAAPPGLPLGAHRGSQQLLQRPDAARQCGTRLLTVPATPHDATAAAASGGAQSAPGAPAPLQLPPPPQQRHQLVCALPQPSTTLQELLVQQSAKQRLVQPAGPASSTEAPAAQGAVGSYRALLDAALRSADPDVTAALLATASAAAAQQQEWRSQLPALDRLLCSWPLAELQEQLQCQPPGAVGRCGQAGGTGAQQPAAARPAPGRADVGQGVSGTCGGNSAVASAPGGVCASRDEESDGESSGGGGGGAQEPLLQFSCTPFRRRRAAQTVPRCRAHADVPHSSGQAPRLARSPMVTALEADACESRGDLWALFCHVMEAHQAEQAAASEAAAAAAAAGGETGLQQHQHQMGAGEEEEQGAEDDPDVYITDDALVCLAALGSEVHGRCGWSLPVMVRQRGSAGAVAAAGGPALCSQPDTPHGTPRRDSMGGSGSMDADDGGAGHGSSCAGEGAEAVCGGGRAGGRTSSRSAAAPSTLYFGPPLLDQLGLVLGSWTRMCTRAMAAGAAGGAAGPGDAVCGHAADGGQGQGCAGDEAVDGLHEVPTAAHSDSCECCQQDEWRLGPGASLLVLSHCDVAAAASGTCSRAGAQAPAGWQADGRPGGMAVAAEVEPVQVMALAARGSAYAAQAAGCNGVDSGASGTSAAAAALAAAAAHYPELACRAQLLRGCVETQVGPALACAESQRNAMCPPPSSLCVALLPLPLCRYLHPVLRNSMCYEPVPPLSSSCAGGGCGPCRRSRPGPAAAGPRRPGAPVQPRPGEWRSGWGVRGQNKQGRAAAREYCGSLPCLQVAAVHASPRRRSAVSCCLSICKYR